MTWFDANTASDDDKQVADYMSRLAGATIPVAPRLPSAEAIWLKAEMLRRWGTRNTALGPVDMMERIQIAAGVAAGLVLLVRSFPSLLQVLGRG
jgi:hypothetical protein